MSLFLIIVAIIFFQKFFESSEKLKHSPINPETKDVDIKEAESVSVNQDNEKAEIITSASASAEDRHSKWIALTEERKLAEKQKLEAIRQKTQEEKRQKEIEYINNKKKIIADFLSNSIIRKDYNDIIEWIYTPITSDDSYKELQNQRIELRTCISNNSLVEEDTSIPFKLQDTDGPISYGYISIHKQGIITLGGDIENGRRIINPNTLIISVDTSETNISALKESIEQKALSKEQEKNNIATRRKQREDTLEKERIRQKLLNQKRKRELERKVQQEMIENGELVMEGTKRRHIPHSIVSEVYRRDGGKCVFCGSTENLQLDHIIPFSKGGADTVENLQVLCQKCNLQKSNKI